MAGSALARRRSREWHAANRDYANAKRKARYHENAELRERQRSAKLLATFGLTAAEYEALLVAQNGLCAICGEPETQKRQGQLKRLAVDHCHSSGRVRQLLCNRCNLVLGKVYEDETLLRKAAKYLEAHRG